MFDAMTFDQFSQHFEKEEDCINFLFAARWPNGFNCPSCSHEHFYTICTRKMPLYQCRSCHSQTSITAGTIMEKSRTSLKRWFQAIYLHAQSESVSAKHLASIIETTYKTSWLICHKIRHAMSHADSTELLSGIVQVNWGNYGTPYNPTVFRHPQEHPLLIGASYDLSGEITQLKIKQVRDEHLQDNHVSVSAGHYFKKQHVDPNAIGVSIVNQKFSPNRFKPLIEICRQASNWINDTFMGIGSKHLQSYLDQFSFGYTGKLRGKGLFEVLFQHCINTPVITYPMLIARANHSFHHKNHYTSQLLRVS